MHILVSATGYNSAAIWSQRRMRHLNAHRNIAVTKISGNFVHIFHCVDMWTDDIQTGRKLVRFHLLAPKFCRVNCVQIFFPFDTCRVCAERNENLCLTLSQIFTILSGSFSWDAWKTMNITVRNTAVWTKSTNKFGRIVYYVLYADSKAVRKRNLRLVSFTLFESLATSHVHGSCYPTRKTIWYSFSRVYL
jgi:hypothetical protein